MKDTELAWAAGFFDGEGSTANARNGKYHRVLISVSQTTLEPLERFRDALGGLGNIHGPYQRTDPRFTGVIKPFWVYQCQAQGEVRAVYETLKPWLCSIKREQMEACLREFDARQAERPDTDRGAATRKAWVTRKARMAEVA